MAGDHVIKTFFADKQNKANTLSVLEARKGEKNAKAVSTVTEIIEAVKKDGINAVNEYSLKLDGRVPYEITEDELKKAYGLCDKKLVIALEKAAENIRTYHEKMLVSSWEFKRREGAVTGQIVRGLDTVGMYVPGGTAAYPSSVLMNAIPAKVAEVRQLVMVTPPKENINLTVLAAAYIAGVDRVIAVGGVQAAAALAFGAGFIPKADKIVGPGNAYVAEAKRQLFGIVDIDMIAGPSEILIIADGSANYRYIAADMLSQAEHDPMASAILLTDSKETADKVAVELETQAKRLPRRDVIEKSLSNYGMIIVCDDLDECADFANEVAPEHLELLTGDNDRLLKLIRNAGAVFVGEYSPEPLGDYMAGPCHVLPTSGTARFFSPLSTDTFLKKMSVIKYDRKSLLELAEDICILASSEGLEAHRNAIERRMVDESDR